MKKLSTSLILAAIALSGLTARASGTIDLRGTEYRVDTLFHAKVGPGTTHTSLRLVGPNPLNVFYATVDLTTPGVSIRTVCATDHVAGAARTSAMAKAKTHDGLHYFVGTNGDFYTTSGNATNGSSKIGTPTTSCIVDGEIYKSSNSNYQFTVDRDGVPVVSRLNYYTGTAKCQGKTTLLKGINVSSPNNGVTIYTHRYWGSANQGDYAGACAQVTARLVEGDRFTAGGKYRFEVTSDPTDDGDLTIPDGGFVIHGRGTSTSGCDTGALPFVQSLKTGDIVEMDNIILTAEGKQIYPYSTISGNPKNVGGGMTLDTEGERGDASGRHPRTCIGHSADGHRVIMMVIDGRSSVSAGVTTSMLADVMRYAGADEAVNIDGGGSSTFYTEALGVLNRTSDGTERAVGNAVFAVLEAPEDDVIAELQFVDWAKQVPQCGLYTPRIFAFNRYGLMIDDNFKGYTLTCPEQLGIPINDGKSIEASGSGTHAVTAHYGDISVSIPVTVVEASDYGPRYPSVVLNSTRIWDAELVSTVNGESLPVAPTAFSWTSSDNSIVEVSAQGKVHGLANGTAVITGTRGDQSVDIEVNVQIPDKQYLPVSEMNPESWNVTKASMSSVEVSPLDNGFAIDYTIKSTRGARVTLQNKKPIYSLPEAVRIRINPGEALLTNIKVELKPANAARQTTFTFTDIKPSTENIFTINLAENFDVSDLGCFPIEFSSLVITPASAAGTPCHIDIPGIEAVYDPASLGIGLISQDDDTTHSIAVNGSVVTFSSDATDITVADSAGITVRSIRSTSAGGSIDLSELTDGLYIVSAKINGETQAVKVIR